MGSTGALTDAQRNKIEANIKQLDYLRGNGLITNNRKRLAKELFVFIGAGGTGCKALARLKQTVVNQVEARDIEKQVMFLAIDTAMKELNDCVDSDVFSIKEVLKVPFNGAHNSINPNNILPQLSQWVHKSLWAETGGDAAVAKEFNGTGAGGKRQCGRVLFSQPAAQNALYNRLTDIQTLAAKTGGTNRIQVFFLSGLAGGTGSGIILDLAFLTRHFLKSILGPAFKTVTFSAYLFLPSASGDSASVMPQDALNGNCNAYAALKEIDHYMTLTERNEHYEMDYGTIGANNVDISENVFDFCTLVEGIGNDGIFFQNHAETSRQIVADSILNIICAGSTKPGPDGQQKFLVDSFLSNMTAKTREKIEQHSDSLWPRDTNYIYSVIGYSSCIVPIDLLTAYVAKKIFDEVFKSFRRADDVTEENVIEFLEDCGLGIREMGRTYKTLSKERMRKDIQAQADEEFKANGPYYMVNLTKSAMDLIENAPNDYLHKASNKKKGFNADKWFAIEKRYEEAVRYLMEINHSLYEVYSYAITVLKDIIDANVKLITETKEYQEHFGKSFCWSPVDLTPGDQATAAVAEYLDDMLDRKAIADKARMFMEDMCSKKAEWTGIERDARHGVLTFNVARAIRDFIASNFQECINTTLEEFLVKAYSGKKDAPVFTYEPGSGREICSEETKSAAKIILERLSGSASALAPVNNFDLAETYSNVYLILPDNCPWLHEAIIEHASAYKINKDNIYESSAKDSVTLCRLYAGIPAWALFWTAGAEESYEGQNGQGPLRTGLHMDQGENGTNWADLPNLYPEKLWSPVQRSVRKREAGISQRVRMNMEKAKALGLLVKDNIEHQYYNLRLLEESSDIEELTKELKLQGNKKYTLEEIIEGLLSTGKFSSFKVQFVNMVMTTTDSMNKEEEEKYLFELSCRIIRRRWKEYQKLEKTLLMIEKLEAFVKEHNKVVIEDSVLATFINCLKWELLVYDGRRNIWKGMLGNESALGQRLDDRFSQICAHFHGFYAFAALDNEKREEYVGRLNELLDNATDEQYEQIEKKNDQLKNSLTLLRYAGNSRVKPWPDDSPFKSANENPWPMTTLDFEEKAEGEEKASIIRNFYTELINNM